MRSHAATFAFPAKGECAATLFDERHALQATLSAAVEPALRLSTHTERLIFLSGWLRGKTAPRVCNVGITFKEQYMDPNQEKADEMSQEAARARRDAAGVV